VFSGDNYSPRCRSAGNASTARTRTRNGSSQPISRVQARLDAVIEKIEKDEKHPVTVTSNRVREWVSQNHWNTWLPKLIARVSRRKIIGYWIPLLCLASLAAGAAIHKE